MTGFLRFETLSTVQYICRLIPKVLYQRL